MVKVIRYGQQDIDINDLWRYYAADVYRHSRPYSG